MRTISSSGAFGTYMRSGRVSDGQELTIVDVSKELHKDIFTQANRDLKYTIVLTSTMIVRFF